LSSLETEAFSFMADHRILRPEGRIAETEPGFELGLGLRLSLLPVFAASRGERRCAAGERGGGICASPRGLTLLALSSLSLSLSPDILF
jgi:hypothetical protein